jgi:predicted dehydrogenase
MDGKHILILGAGSVGKRHARNLAALGCRISCMDLREDRCRELAQEVGGAPSYTDESEALTASRYDGVVVGSPPHVHVRQSLAALKAGLPVLLEKPVAPDLEGARRLAAAVEIGSVPLLMGYTWRWWPPLRKVQALLGEGAIGTVRHVQFHMSAHLADWHPWERYEDFFMARREMGGGALLDESHWIDLMLWLFGIPSTVSGRIDKISDLQIDSDDNVDLLFAYDDGPRVTMHLDLYGRPHEKSIRFVGSEGTLYWSADPNEIRIGRGWQQDWEILTYQCERNDMFIAAAQEFLGVLAGKPAVTCTIKDGVRVLDVVETARRASSEGRVVSSSRSS